MNTRGQSIPQILTMVLFSLSCFGLLLFLWLSFGGSIPLNPRGYRVQIPFPQAGQLVSQAPVRISGVDVGKVVAIESEPKRTLAIVEIERKYAPLPRDVRATLRQKTLLGETYIELTPGTRGARELREGETLAAGGVQEQVELDQILQSFTPRTRAELKTWLRQWGRSVSDRGPDVSATLGQLPVLADEAAGVLGVLDRQREAVRRVVRDGTTVFDTLAARDAEVRTLVTDGGRVLSSTAALPTQLRATVRALPPLLRALRRVERTQRALFTEIRPAIRDLRPTVDLLAPTLRTVQRTSPDISAIAVDLRRVNRSAPSGFPALTRVVRAARPALPQLEQFAAILTPVAQFLDLYKQEFVSSWQHAAGAAQATSRSPGSPTGKNYNYIRIMTPVDDESLSTTNKLASIRSNPYRRPGGLDEQLGRRTAFTCAGAGSSARVLGRQQDCLVQEAFEFRGQRRQYPQLTPVPSR